MGGFWAFLQRLFGFGAAKSAPALPQIDGAKIASGRARVAHKVLMDAVTENQRLLLTRRALKNDEVKDRIGKLGLYANKIMEKVEVEPQNLTTVQRFLIYYLPRAADVAESIVQLERLVRPDPDRLARSIAMLGKLEQAFAHYVDTLDDEDHAALDIELDLLDRSLKEDMRP